MEERQNIALFDHYLSGEMDAEEKSAFEERLMHSESLKKSVDDYKVFVTEIAEGAEYGSIHTELKSIHNNLYGKKRSILLKGKFLIPIGIAASIGLLFLISPFSGMNNDTASEDSNYEPLANHSDDGFSQEAADDAM
tara:strand:+ start:1934 stop:2344 length:411 start_codon:yes stop_codon:yes gene_type:complete